MAILFSIVFGLLFGIVVGGSVGFVKPKWTHRENRKEVLKFVGSSFVLIIIVALFVPKEIEVNSTANLLAFLFGLWIPFWNLKKWEAEVEEEKQKKKNKKTELSTPKVNITVTKSHEDKDEYEIDQHIDDIPVYTKKQEVKSTKFKIPRYNTKKSDILHIKDITDYSDMKKNVKSLKDYNFEAKDMIELEINHENELFYAVNRNLLSTGNYGLSYDQEKILCSKASFDFYPNVFAELYSLYIDEEYEDIEIEHDLSSFEFIETIKRSREEQYNLLMKCKKDELIELVNKSDSSIEAVGTKAVLSNLILDNNLEIDNQFYYKINKQKFENFLDKIAKDLMFAVDLLIGEWHVYGQLEVYQLLNSDYELLNDLIKEKVEELKIEVSLLEEF